MTQELPDGLARYLAENLARRQRCYCKRLARCRKKNSMGAVHALRIETRRILALLDLLELWRFGDPVRKLRKTFKKRLDAFSELRDTQVQLRLLKPFWKDFPEAAEFKKFLCWRENKLKGKLASKLKRIKSRKLNTRLKQVSKCLGRRRPCQPAPEDRILAAKALQSVFKEVAARRPAVRREDPGTIHHLRVAFKRFRYLNELLKPFLSEITPERLNRLKAYQSAAGDIQDLVVLLARLECEVQQNCISAESARRLQSELSKRREQAIDFFMGRVDDLFNFDPEPWTRSGTKRQR